MGKQGVEEGVMREMERGKLRMNKRIFEGGKNGEEVRGSEKRRDYRREEL